MTVEIALVLLLVAGALALFASQRLPLDLTALLILIALMAVPLAGHSPWLLARGVDLRSAFPTVREGLSGLSSPATVTVLAMFVLSAGIQRSGLIHVLGRRLAPLVAGSELRMLLVIALLVGPVSGLINNTATVAVAIPLVVDLARRLDLRASRLLLPVSFFGMLGGTLTLIGTSTNILAASILAERPGGGRAVGLFEITPLGAIVLLTGVVYFVTVGRRLLPEQAARKSEADDDPRFVVELGVPEGSPLAGATLEESDFLVRSGVSLIALVRGGRAYRKRAATTTLATGDVLLASAGLRQILDLIKSERVEVLSELGSAQRVRGDGLLVRALLRNRQLFDGRTGAQVDFWRRYEARPIGLRVEEVRSRRLADEPLQVGEVVLLQLSRTALARLRRNPDLVLLEETEDDFDRRKMAVAAAIVAGVVALAALTPVPIVVSALIGMAAMALTGCLEKQDLYSGVSWDVIFLLAGVIPLGIAMTKSGAADLLAGLLAAQAADWHPIVVLMVLYAVTTVLTELVSNNASVVVLVPVAISLAGSLAVDPLPLALAVMFAASTSFLTPVGYQTNAMVYGTGLYRFTDFARVGAPLNALLMVVTSVAIWWLWIA